MAKMKKKAPAMAGGNPKVISEAKAKPASPKSMAAEGKEPKIRSDRPARKSGGRVGGSPFSSAHKGS